MLKAVKIETSQVSQSSNYSSNAYAAECAVNGSNTFTHTLKGIGMWWRAKFPQEHLFKRIRIQNRSSCGSRLAKTKVMVSGKLAGSLPDVTKDNQWYEISCDHRGDEIKLVTTQDAYLSIKNIEVYAEVEMEQDKTIRLERDTYIHILNHITQITSVRTGPETYVKKDYEEVVVKMTKNIQLPPNSYVIVENPVMHNNEASKPLIDEYGCYKLDFGETQVRTSDQWQDSFPLYPGEVLLTPKPEPMLVVSKDEAIRIQVERDYTSANGTVMRSGQIYQRQGPLTYVPRKEEYFLRKIQKTVIKQNNALELLATNEFVDRDGVKRTNGERWFYDVVGSFWPGVYETIQKTISGVVLNDNKSIHILGLNDFKDQFGVERKAGQKWLVTNKMSSVFLPSVYEKVLKTVNIITLSNREYIRVTNPYSTEKGCIQRGTSEIRMGELTFFEHPDECLGEKERIKVLSSDESMVLKANREYQDKSNNVTRKAGEKWLMKGPGEYYPSIDVNV